MHVVYSEAHLLHHPSTELYDGLPTPIPELPDRIETIRARLKKRTDVIWHAPDSFSDDTALAHHNEHYVSYLQKTCASMSKKTEFVSSNFIHDTYAPLSDGTWRAARSALDAALTGAQILRKTSSPVYVLCRPPGHHAGDAYMGGYCYFNNAGAAAQELSKVGRVTILDIDYHHGNGTQQLFYERADVQYISVHANPANQYPYTHGFIDEIGSGAGTGVTHNFIVEKDCGWSVYENAIRSALQEVQNFAPDYLVVSLGFDGYKDDPIAGFGLSLENYSTIARLVKDLQLPTLLIQEGGYCIDALGELANAVVQEFSV